MSLTLAATVGVLFAAGSYLVMQRALTRIVLGVSLLGHGANLLLLASGGRAGAPPFGDRPGADPLPQAMALTAVVISFGLTVFLLALAYRSWEIDGDDEVEDDFEDARIAHLAPDLDDVRVSAFDEGALDDLAAPDPDGGDAP
jgi:multicomponent Na+:H+ antiporter subunit C